MKVSVVTICLNGAEHLAEALQSVADQDYVDFEHLVIDGESTDGSLEIIRAFAEKHPSLRWWSEKDGGISDAMNRGIEYASGDFVAFLHADDLFASPTVLSEVTERLSSDSNAVWLTAGIKEIDANGRTLRILPARRFSRRRLLRNNILFHPATFVCRDTMHSVGGFDVLLRYAMDYDLWLRLADVSSPVVLDKVVSCFRVHTGSRSSEQRLKALDEEYQVRCRYTSGPLERMVHGLYQFFRKHLETDVFRR